MVYHIKIKGKNRVALIFSWLDEDGDEYEHEESMTFNGAEQLVSELKNWVAHGRYQQGSLKTPHSRPKLKEPFITSKAEVVSFALASLLYTDGVCPFCKQRVGTKTISFQQVAKHIDTGNELREWVRVMCRFNTL